MKYEAPTIEFALADAFMTATPVPNIHRVHELGWSRLAASTSARNVRLCLDTLPCTVHPRLFSSTSK